MDTYRKKDACDLGEIRGVLEAKVSRDLLIGDDPEQQTKFAKWFAP